MCPTRAGLDAPTPSETWTIVVAGGSGLRFGSRKQFVELAGRTVLDRAVETAETVSDGVVVVVPADAVDELIDHYADRQNVRVVAGGETRASSVRAGLTELGRNCQVVLVHDAARPLATTELFERVRDAVQCGAQAVVPAVTVADTVRSRTSGVLDRQDLLAIQTPQGFTATALMEAHEGRGDATDDATLVEACGYTVSIVEGEVENRKITDPVDLIAAEAVLHHRAATATTATTATTAAVS